MTRSLFIVRLVQPIPQLEGYDAVLAQYWSAVSAQLDRLQTTTGPVRRIFAETATGRGEDAIVNLQQMNPQAATLVRRLATAGAVVEEFEDAQLLAELLDWGRCAQQGLQSEKVRRVVQAGHDETAGARDEHLARRLNDAIGDDEAALALAVSPPLAVPERVERFIVSPPELDQLERWLRAKMEEARREMMMRAQAGQTPTAGDPTSENQGDSGGSSLWTPS